MSQIAYMCPFTAFTVCIKRFTLTNTVPVSVGLCSGPNTEWHSVHFLLAVTAVLVICRRRTGGTKQGGYFLINTNGDSNICKIPCCNSFPVLSQCCVTGHASHPSGPTVLITCNTDVANHLVKTQTGQATSHGQSLIDTLQVA